MCSICFAFFCILATPDQHDGARIRVFSSLLSPGRWCTKGNGFRGSRIHRGWVQVVRLTFEKNMKVSDFVGFDVAYVILKCGQHAMTIMGACVSEMLCSWCKLWPICCNTCCFLSDFAVSVWDFLYAQTKVPHKVFQILQYFFFPYVHTHVKCCVDVAKA